MRPRDEAVAKAAVETLLRPGAGYEVRRCASAALASLGVDEYVALADAREARKATGTPGPLRKDAGSGGGITVHAPMGKDSTLRLDMTPAEATSLVNAVFDALGGRSS